MAKLQAVIAMTLDGSIPTESEPLMEWIQSDRDGFPYWRKRGTRLLFPGYPLVSLICEKDTAGPSTVFHAEIYDEKSVEFLRGLSLYSLVDELVIFLIPSGSVPSLCPSPLTSRQATGGSSDPRPSGTACAVCIIAGRCNRPLQDIANAICPSALFLEG